MSTRTRASAVVATALALIAVPFVSEALAGTLSAKCQTMASQPAGDRAVLDALIRAFAENGQEYRGCADLDLSFEGMTVRVATAPVPNVRLLRAVRGLDSLWFECRAPFSPQLLAEAAPLRLVNFMLSNDTGQQPGCGVVDLAAFAAVKTIEKIYVSNVDIASVAPFAGLDRLIDLSITSSNVKDLEPIHRLVQLRSLYLHGNQLTRLIDLMSLTNLVELNLSANEGLQDLMGVQYMSNLRKLSLNHGTLTDIAPLGSLVWLEELVVNRNKIANVDVLAGLPRLRVVGIAGNAVEDISALAKHEHLEELMLGKNPIRDYLPIAKPGVRKLEIEAATHVTDWSFLSRMVDLEELVLYHSGITDLEPLTSALADLPRLATLNLSSNRIRDFSSLRRLPALRDLNVMGNGLTSLTTLVGNVDLDVLAVGHEPTLDWRDLGKVRSLRVHLGGVTADTVPCPTGMQCYYQDF